MKQKKKNNKKKGKYIAGGSESNPEQFGEILNNFLTKTYYKVQTEGSKLLVNVKSTLNMDTPSSPSEKTPIIQQGGKKKKILKKK